MGTIGARKARDSSNHSQKVQSLGMESLGGISVNKKKNKRKE